MNNSLPRLIDGMVATLRKEVIPHIEGDFARGQAFWVIYMFNSLKLRASWLNEFLIEQLRALEDAARELDGSAREFPPLSFPAGARRERRLRRRSSRRCATGAMSASAR